MNREQIDFYFSMLDESLRSHTLPTEDGGSRKAGAAEFMLMNIKEIWVYFKHIDTRNYLMMNKFNGKIFIPTGGAFRLGFFDLLGQ